MMKARILYVLLLIFALPGPVFADNAGFSIFKYHEIFKIGMFVSAGMFVLLLLWELVAMIAGLGGGKLKKAAVNVNIVDDSLPPEDLDDDPIKSLIKSQIAPQPIEEEPMLPSFLNTAPTAPTPPMRSYGSETGSSVGSPDDDPFKSLLKSGEVQTEQETPPPAPKMIREQAPVARPPVTPPPPQLVDDDDPFKSLLKSAKKEAAEELNIPKPGMQKETIEDIDNSNMYYTPPEQVKTQEQGAKLSLSIPKRPKKSDEEELEMFGGSEPETPVKSQEKSVAYPSFLDEPIPKQKNVYEEEKQSEEQQAEDRKKISLKLPTGESRSVEAAVADKNETIQTPQKKNLSLNIPKNNEKQPEPVDTPDNDKPKRLTLNIKKTETIEPIPDEPAPFKMDPAEKPPEDLPKTGTPSLEKLVEQEHQNKSFMGLTPGFGTEEKQVPKAPKKIIISKKPNPDSSSGMFELSADLNERG